MVTECDAQRKSEGRERLRREASRSTAGLALDVVILCPPAFDATVCWLSILRLQKEWRHILGYRV